ncbi:MAG TPA: CopD family protein [Chromatiaceae bacterium]|jgi:uncharacterized membrane protein|nr:CopD family protein [Chromatiaceae bacterium]
MNPALALAIAFGLHQLATVIWVGGMFFAHVAMRPAAKQTLKGVERLQLMQGVFRRFFPWVWICVITLWATGAWGFAANGIDGVHVHLMMGLAGLMTAIFIYIFFVPYRKLKLALEHEDLGRASAKLGIIRRLILVNLLLGVVTLLVGSVGRFAVALAS